MTTSLTKPPSTTHDEASRDASVTSANARKNRLDGALAAGVMFAISGTALWSTMAVLDEAGPSVQQAGTVTRIEAHNDPRVSAFSGPMVPLEPVSTTVSQRNAVRTAKSYLSYTAFSRKGLIQQLEYEGFSTVDATFAVDSIAVDWNA